MANDYYNHGAWPATGAAGDSAPARSELDAITAGFNKLPPLIGNNNRAVVVNPSGSALAVTVGALSLAGDFTLSGAFNLTLSLSATVTLTLPAISDTLVGRTTTDTLTNKSVNLANNTLTGTLAQFNTALSDGNFASLDGTETLTNKTLTSPVITTPTGFISAFGLTLVDDADAAAARATLDAMENVFTTRGDLVRGGASGVPERVGLGASGTFLKSDGTDAVWGAGDFTTGDVKLTLKTTADTGWVLMDDKTIGDGSSGADGRANADTEALFTLLWNNVTDDWCPVSSGRGASAAADFAAHKTIRLPRTLGRALAGYGTPTMVDSGGDAGVDIGADTLTVPSNINKWNTGQALTFTLSSGTITGLTSGNTYYVIRISNTTIKLASSLANAQNGTAIDLTAKSSPVWTLTAIFSGPHPLGSHAGEQAHAQSVSEMLSHYHSTTALCNTWGQAAGSCGWINEQGGSGTIATDSKGGNTSANIIQTTVFLNVMVKL